MLYVLLLPLLALLGGAAGFLLRRWELSTAFEASGLVTPWAFPSLALIALSILLAAVFALLCRGKKNELKDYSDAFSAPAGWGYLAVTAIASAFLLVAAVFGFLKELDSDAPRLLYLLLWALALIAFCCVLVTILNNFRQNARQYSLVLLSPAYMCCLWLALAYQKRAADPVVLDYVYELFAIICILLAFYFEAGFSFERPRVWCCSFFGLLSVYLSIVTLADKHDHRTYLLFLFSALYQIATVTVLLYNAFAAKPKRLLAEGEETQEVTQDE